MVRAEIISIGDEMTSGQRLDTNSQWLSQQLDALGIEVAFHTTVGDSLIDNVQVFQTAAARADLIVASGGLGPTADDLTREALAQTAGVELELHLPSLEYIQQLFASRGRQMPERNRVQAFFPQGASPIQNANGTAPGIQMPLAPGPNRQCQVYCLPGVPAEMREMWTASVVPDIRSKFPDLPLIVRYVLKCFGLGESELEAKLPDMIRRGRNPLVGITVSQATISLRIAAMGSSHQACQELIEQTEQEIRACLGDVVFGTAEEELPEVLAKLLLQRGETVAVAEWGSLGNVCSALVPFQNVFRGGMTASSLSAWNLLLPHPSPAIAELRQPQEFQDWSKRAAEQVRQQLSADYGLAVGPILPEGDSLYFALATPDETVLRTARLLGHPEIIAPRTMKRVLDELRLHLLKLAAS